LPRVLAETLRDLLSVDLAANSWEGYSQNGLEVRKVEVQDPAASVPMRPAQQTL
jgi:hypothetical protein